MLQVSAREDWRTDDHATHPPLPMETVKGGGGQPSSVAKRVLERMDAFLDETHERGRMPSYGKVALAVVVGNEDGAHHTAAELFQALAEVGFTIPPGGVTYWIGEAMGEKEYKDFSKPPKAVAKWTPILASNAAHLAPPAQGAGLSRHQGWPLSAACVPCAAAGRLRSVRHLRIASS